MDLYILIYMHFKNLSDFYNTFYLRIYESGPKFRVPNKEIPTYFKNLTIFYQNNELRSNTHDNSREQWHNDFKYCELQDGLPQTTNSDT